MSRRDARVLLDTLELGGTVERGEGPAAGALREGWRSVHGRAMAAALAWEGGVQWLARRLGSLGLAEAPPAELRASLRAAATAERAANLQVDEEAEEVVRYLLGRGIPCVLIKGTARRAAAGLYPCADARATVDVDMLLTGEGVEAAWHDLRARGWPLATDASATPAGHYHPPPLRGPHGVTVELHRSTAAALPPDEAWRRANSGADVVDWHGLRVRVPPATELLWHGLAHALDAGPRAFRLRYFLDGAAILAAGAALDWEELAARVSARAEVDPRLARAWLGAAARLAGRPLPPLLSDAQVSFDLVRTMAWRLAVLGRGGGARFGERLLEEGTRAELRLPVTPVVEGTGAFRRSRRWVAGRAARLAYRAWRAA